MCFSSSLIKILMRTWRELSLNLFSFQNLMILILWSSWDPALWSVTAWILHNYSSCLWKTPWASIIPSLPCCLQGATASSKVSNCSLSWQFQASWSTLSWWRPATLGTDWLSSVSLFLVSLASELFLNDVIDGLESFHWRLPKTEKMNSFSTAMCICVFWHLGNNWSHSPRVNQRSSPGV